MNIFLRHGEVKNPKNILYYNIPGYELSEKGIKQAEHIAEKLKKDFKIEKIISSPLLRARQTSKIVNKILKIEITISDEITEWGGIKNWIGNTTLEIQQSKEFGIYINDPTELNTDESFFDTFKRADKLYENNQNVLFVSHQDTIRSFMFYKLKSDNFNKNKPGHCDLQYIDQNEFKNYTNPV